MSISRVNRQLMLSEIQLGMFVLVQSAQNGLPLSQQQLYLLKLKKDFPITPPHASYSRLCHTVPNMGCSPQHVDHGWVLGYGM
jgi:hypothetical protein